MFVLFFLVLMLVLFALVMVVLGFLHALDHFFGLDAVAKNLQQIDDLHVLIDGIFQRVLDPAVGLAADIDKEVAVGNFDNIIGSGLIAVQINAVVQKHGDLSVVSLVAEDFPDPVVFRENGGDDFQFLRFGRGLRFRRILRGGRLRRGQGSFFRRRLTAPGSERTHQNNSKQHSDKFFHIKIKPP